MVGEQVHLDHDGVIARFTQPSAASEHEKVSDGQVAAPMGGKVVAVDVEVGARVEAGQRLLAIEAMKMEHRVVASVSGTVTAVSASAGDQVASGQILVSIEQPEEEQT